MIRDVAKLSVETADQLTTSDIHELCDAEEAILAGGGFGWLSYRLTGYEDYWRGVGMIQNYLILGARQTSLVVAKCAATKNNEAQKLLVSSQHSLLPLGPAVMV